MTKQAAADRLAAALRANLPARGWTEVDGRFEAGETTVQPFPARRTVAVCWPVLTSGAIHLCRVVVGPLGAGRGWPERLAYAASAFVKGEPVPGVRHRRVPPPEGLETVRVRVDCPACSVDTFVPLPEVLAPSPWRCVECGVPLAVKIQTATSRAGRPRLVAVKG